MNIKEIREFALGITEQVTEMSFADNCIKEQMMKSYEIVVNKLPKSIAFHGKRN